MSDSATPWAAACQASLSFTNSQSFLKLMSIDLVMPSNHLIFCHPLLLSSIFLTIRVFSSASALRIRWPKHWNFSFKISSSSEYSGLVSIRIDWLDLLAFQGILKSLLQHLSSKASIFFSAQPSLWSSSHNHTWLLEKTIALIRWTFVGKVMSLLFDTLSGCVIDFFQGASFIKLHGCSYHLQWFWSPRK